MHFLLFYEKAPDYAAKQQAFQKEHLAYVIEGARSGGIVLAGSLGSPADGAAVLLFEAPGRDAAERFAKGDPYVREGIVNRWWVREWHTVVGKDAAEPVRV